jgi:hypothetical protein
VFRHDLKGALVSSGMKDARAEECAQKAGGSLTVLKRLLAPRCVFRFNFGFDRFLGIA